MTVNGHDVEARYRQALLDQPEVSRVTLTDGHSVGIQDIYVNRTLLHDVVQKEPEPSNGPRAATRDAKPQREITVKLPVELWPKLRDERVVLVEGPAGMGKSTFTKQLVHESGAQHRIPIWIPFRLFVGSGLSILEYLDQHYVPWLGLSDLRVPYRADGTGNDRSLGHWCYDQWQSGLGLLILDGLDEVFRHEERVAALKALPITGTGPTRPATILTSRPLSQSLPLMMARVEVQGLTPSDQWQFIERYRASLRLTEVQVGRFTREITKQEQGRLQSLLTRPGHLIQILTSYAKTNTLLDSETAVLNHLLESRLCITGRSEPSVGDDAKKKRQVLLSLALHLLACRQGQRQTRAQVLALIQQVLWEHATYHVPLYPLVQATALLNDLTRNSGLLTEVEPEVYECETVIWLQHVTGSALADEPTCTSLGLTDSHVLGFLDKKAWDPEWEPVLKSWVGQAHNPLPLFDRLMKEKHDDLARHRLGMAGRCLAEIQVDQLQQPHYQVLIERISEEAFVVWEANVERNSERLVTTLLRGAWVETEVGQMKLLAWLQSPRCKDWAVFSALRSLGAAIPIPVQQALAAWLRSSDLSFLRLTVIHELEGLGDALPVEVQQALVAALMNCSDDEGLERVPILMELGEAIPVSLYQALVARLIDSDEGECDAVVNILWKLGVSIPDSVQQAFVARLVDSDSEVCRKASLAVSTLRMAIPVPMQRILVARLEDFDRNVRWAAAMALWGLGAAMPDAVRQALVARLADSDVHVREVAAAALGELGMAMPVSVQQALVARLEDPEWGAGKAAGEALNKVGTAMAISVQQALVKQLTDLDETVRGAAAWALSGLGVAMPVTVQQALVARLTDPSDDVRWKTGRVLGNLGMTMPVTVQQALIGQLEDKSRIVRRIAAESLGEMGIGMPVSVQEALVVRLTDPDTHLCRAVAEALGRVGAGMAVSVQEALMGRLTDSDKDLCRAVGEALGKVGAGMAVSVQGALMARLTDPDKDLRRVAVSVLRGLRATMPVTVQEVVIGSLTDSDWTVRSEAVEALSSAQQQGLRFFLQGKVVREGRLVSELSATASFSDGCHASHRAFRSSASWLSAT